MVVLLNNLKDVTGEIQNIKAKSVQIENDWYNSFTELKGFNKGHVVRVQYTENKKDNKVFRNIKNIELLGTIIEDKKELNRVESEYKLDKIEYQTIDTLLLIAKDIYIETIKANQTEIIPMFDETLEDVFDAYNRIIRGKK